MTIISIKNYDNDINNNNDSNIENDNNILKKLEAGPKEEAI